MTGNDPAAVMAVPGDLDTPTGGYAYARRLLAEAAAAGWPLRHLALPGGFPFADAAALAETARRLQAVPRGTPLIVDGLAYGVLPLALLRGLAGPVIALCHHPLARETGLDPATAEGFAASERTALSAAHAVIASSEATAADLRRDYGVHRVTVARPGTDPQPPAAGSGEAAPLGLSVGTLSPRKGYGVLLAALAELADLPWRWLVIGADDQYPEEAARLAALVRRHGLAERIAFAGARPAEQVALAYHGADLFALASAHEGFGMVFAEAVAHGLPVLGPAIPAVAEATAGGAQLVPADDPDAWAQALRPLLSDAAARAALAERALAASGRLDRWPDTLAAVRRAVEAVTGAER